MTGSGEEAREAYLQSMVEGASREELLIMLLDGAAKFMAKAEEAFDEEKWDEVHNQLCRVQNIYIELMVSLDMESGDFAKNLNELYGFTNELLIKANIDRDRESFEQAKILVEDVREIWKEAVGKLDAEISSVVSKAEQKNGEEEKKSINLTG